MINCLKEADMAAMCDPRHAPNSRYDVCNMVSNDCTWASSIALKYS